MLHTFIACPGRRNVNCWRDVMARIARVEVFAADEVAIVHVMNRTVRRCFLLGDDRFSGKKFQF